LRESKGTENYYRQTEQYVTSCHRSVATHKAVQVK